MDQVEAMYMLKPQIWTSLCKYFKYECLSYAVRRLSLYITEEMEISATCICIGARRKVALFLPLTLASFTNVRKQLGATIKLNKATVDVVGTQAHRRTCLLRPIGSNSVVVRALPKAVHRGA